MGEIFSYVRQLWRPQLAKVELDDQRVGLATLLIRTIKPRCFCTHEEQKQKQLHPPQKQKQMSYNNVKERTLEEWLLASPNYVVNNYSCDGDYDTAESIAIIMKKLLEIDNGIVKGDQKIRSENQSGQIKKRVGFKLPEETDIFIFYSSDSELDE